MPQTCQWQDATFWQAHPRAQQLRCQLCLAGLQITDVSRAAAVIADMRKIIRQDPRIIQKLHRRVFLDKLTREQVQCPCCSLACRVIILQAIRGSGLLIMGNGSHSKPHVCVNHMRSAQQPVTQTCQYDAAAFCLS